MAPAIALKVLTLFSHVFAWVVRGIQAITSRKATSNHSWQKPSPEDRRSPCPMLNALANHGYLPRDGKDISLPRLIAGFHDSINLAPDATLLVGLAGVKTSTTGKRYTLHLDDLAKHGVIEHDGSLSRHDMHDAPSADNKTFAPEVWATAATHLSQNEFISIETAARARRARIAAAKEADPAFSMSKKDLRASALETCLYLRVFGEGTVGRARWEWVRVLFEEERLPFEEGYKRSEKMITISDLLVLFGKLDAVPEDSTASD